MVYELPERKAMNPEDMLFTSDEDIKPRQPKPLAPLAEITKVFEYWVATMRTGKGPKPRLDTKRTRCIGRAIKMYDVDTCMDAVRGCTMSAWHMGQNPQGKRYDDITLILRNADNIEKFAGLAAEDDGGWENE